MNRGLLTAALLGSTALCVSTTLIHAQEVGQLDPIVVKSGEVADPEGPVEGYVASSSRTGLKTGAPLSEVPQSVSVLGREEIDDRGAQQADEALRYTSGVFAQPYGSDSDTNWLFIRGFDATQSGVYQDGMQLFGYGFGAYYVDSFLLERIEVMKGASSALYGSSNPGGFVNYVSKTANGERIRYAETGITDTGEGSFGFDIGDRINDTASYRVVGRVEGGDGYTDFEDGIRGTVSPSVELKLGDSTELTILANLTGIDETHKGGGFLPYYGTVKPASFGRISRKANFTEPGTDVYERFQASIGYQLTHEFDVGWTARQNVRLGTASIHEVNAYTNGYLGGSSTPADASNTLERIDFGHDSDLFTFQADSNLNGTIATGGLSHDVLAGVDFKHWKLDHTQASNTSQWGSFTSISATNPVYGNIAGTRSAYIDQVLSQDQVGVYLQDQIKFGGGFIATLNGRYDWVMANSSGSSQFSTHKSAFSGRAGLGYEFANGLTPYASVSNFFNPLFGGSSVVAAYEPETGTQYEVGVKYEPTFMNALFTLSLFDLTRQNVVGGPYLSEIQTGEINSRGIEIEAKGELTSNLSFLATFTAMDVEIKDDTTTANIGNTPNTTPELQASMWLEYGFDETVLGGALDGVSLGAGVRYTGESWVDDANTLKVPDVTLVDAHIGYEQERWGVDLNVNNVFDETYVASCDSVNSCYYGEGRSMMLRAHAKW